jgi:hypothetical protein
MVMKKRKTRFSSDQGCLTPWPDDGSEDPPQLGQAEQLQRIVTVPFPGLGSLEAIAEQFVLGLAKIGPRPGSALVQLDEALGDDAKAVTKHNPFAPPANDAICISGEQSLVEYATRQFQLQIAPYSFKFQHTVTMASLRVRFALIDECAFAPEDDMFEGLLATLAEAGWRARLLSQIAFDMFYGSPQEGVPVSLKPVPPMAQNGSRLKSGPKPLRRRSRKGRRN